MTNKLEKIYYEIATILYRSVGTEEWDKLNLTTDILQNNCSSLITFLSISSNIRYFQISFDDVFILNDSLILLRDLMLKEMKERIWGLTFTLYPDGKFEIEYDYNKPEDYEETDEVITGEEINQTFLK
ncbi:MAG: hypothetical protein CSA42_07770 [Gammaproteobacteria bacterium]|nr:MAG: hypothetical protein CSA42_07770 [Gammaproteobacteria bacterium]